jgi:hypothetical protein
MRLFWNQTSLNKNVSCRSDKTSQISFCWPTEWIYEAASEFHKNDFLFFVWKMGDGDEIEGERDEGEGEGEGGGTQVNGGITACRAGAVSALFHVG